jgi:hypothetical protein
MKKLCLLIFLFAISTCFIKAQVSDNKFPTYQGSYQYLHVSLNLLNPGISFTEHELEVSVLSIENVVEVDYNPLTMQLTVKGVKPRITEVKAKIVAYGLEITAYTEE